MIVGNGSCMGTTFGLSSEEFLSGCTFLSGSSAIPSAFLFDFNHSYKNGSSRWWLGMNISMYLFSWECARYGQSRDVWWLVKHMKQISGITSAWAGTTRPLFDLNMSPLFPFFRVCFGSVLLEFCAWRLSHRIGWPVVSITDSGGALGVGRPYSRAAIIAVSSFGSDNTENSSVSQYENVPKSSSSSSGAYGCILAFTPGSTSCCILTH